MLVNVSPSLYTTAYMYDHILVRHYGRRSQGGGHAPLSEIQGDVTPEIAIFKDFFLGGYLPFLHFPIFSK